MELIGLARQSYGDFVPKCEPYKTMLGDLHVYVCHLVPGPALCRVRRQFLALGTGAEQLLRQTVDDLARFFASAWNERPAVEGPPGLLGEYHEILDQIGDGFPARLQAKLDEVRRGLPLLFRPGYPMACQHDDLVETNIHVDEATGRITGIVDWADAIIAPFGVSLGGLETVLGVQTLSAWHSHPCHSSLRGRFWDTFYAEIGDLSSEDRRAIEVARLFGLFRAHGSEDKDRAIVYFEALCLP